MGETGPRGLARELLVTVRGDANPRPTERRLGQLAPEELSDALDTPTRARAFWLNLYNAAVQLLLERQPDLYRRKRQFFSSDSLTVAGHPVSLDAIEHDILRNGRWKYGLGYLPNPFQSGFTTRHAIPLDARIHFALNCGATSCPPIAVYTAADLDDQLERATAGYLKSTVSYNPTWNLVHVPRQCLWYRGDFGGKDGILDLLRRHAHLQSDEHPWLWYASYDWQPAPANFVTD